MKEVILVSGATSGIGRATYDLLKRKGYVVLSISRREEKDNPSHYSVDVRKEEDVQKAIGTIIAKYGRIDALINAAGFGIVGAIEFTESDDAKNQFEVNFFGLNNLVKALLPQMRKQQEGKIIAISSMAALTPIPFQAYYSASKAAINSYCASLANEVRPFHIGITSIEPGDICTAFTKNRKSNLTGDNEYEKRISKGIQKMEEDEKNGMNPEVVAKKIFSLLKKKHLKPAYTIGWLYHLFTFLLRLLPSRLTNYILFLMYAK